MAITSAAARPESSAIRARHQKHFHRFRQKADDGSLIVCRQIVFAGQPQREDAIARL